MDVECKPASFYEETLGEEKINAIIPLYINDEHWKIASLRLK